MRKALIGSSTLDGWQGLPHLLSNISDDRRQLIEQAIIDSGRTDIFCRDEAFAMRSGAAEHRLPGYFGLYVREWGDCSDFWAEVRRLETTVYWRTFLSLAESD